MTKKNYLLNKKRRQHHHQQQHSSAAAIEWSESNQDEFKNKHLLKEAFTHSTYGAENYLSYKWLEYMGDVVLNIVDWKGTVNESYVKLKQKLKIKLLN